jgi:hypothetical protein
LDDQANEPSQKRTRLSSPMTPHAIATLRHEGNVLEDPLEAEGDDEVEEGDDEVEGDDEDEDMESNETQLVQEELLASI